jgi:hypothetical protein
MAWRSVPEWLWVRFLGVWRGRSSWSISRVEVVLCRTNASEWVEPMSMHSVLVVPYNYFRLLQFSEIRHARVDNSVRAQWLECVRGDDIAVRFVSALQLRMWIRRAVVSS